MGAMRGLLLVFCVAALAVCSLSPGARRAIGTALDEVRWRIQGESPDACYLRAERYFQREDYEKSEWACRRALRLNPNHAPARALLMELEFMLGRGRLASIVDYSRYMSGCGPIKHDQTLVEIDNALAKAVRLLEAVDFEGAGKEYRKVIEYAKWLPVGLELDRRRKVALEGLDRIATLRSAEEGRALRAGPSGPSSP